MFAALALTLYAVLATSAEPLVGRQDTQCRYAPSFSLSDIQTNASSFIQAYLAQESRFHTPNVSYNEVNGMTYDGTLLNPTTGERNVTGGHPFSAASKESLQIMMYALTLSGDPDAAIWVCSDDPGSAQEKVVGLLSKKLKTYRKFNETFPGFGGYLPWFLANDTDIQPTSDWVNRVPALDNGELIWAVYAVVQVLRASNQSDWQELASGWQEWLNYISITGPKIFYYGDGNICTVVNLNQSLNVDDPAQTYSCPQTAQPYLNDPYEGELFTWFFYLYASNLSSIDRDALWSTKRPQLVAVNYTGSVVDTSPSSAALVNYTGDPVVHPYDTITVQKGFWFSSHEQWKLLEMPYLDDQYVYRIFHNAERVRTCDAVLIGNPGMFASVNNVSNPATGDVFGYISAAGIPSISNQTSQELNIITPYSTFPTLLFNQTVGVAWLHNMLLGKGMQNPYGSTESTSRDGSDISAFVSWDSKVTTVVGLLGGVSRLVRDKMKTDGVYDSFRQRLGEEYGRGFPDGLLGENVDLCWPADQIPNGGAMDFTNC
ncbi:putative GPI anchored protein [Naematelia encephala]|uniref:Putative GPI anchored protein n=1 Tax=Naematelia encephala TaxID=71784 RepID=A0A1Y2AU28_9TREE|nr:putative GPI anchored protein [Naematelia encephala]